VPVQLVIGVAGWCRPGGSEVAWGLIEHLSALSYCSRYGKSEVVVNLAHLGSISMAFWKARRHRRLTNPGEDQAQIVPNLGVLGLRRRCGSGPSAGSRPGNTAPAPIVVLLGHPLSNSLFLLAGDRVVALEHHHLLVRLGHPLQKSPCWTTSELGHGGCFVLLLDRWIAEGQPPKGSAPAGVARRARHRFLSAPSELPPFHGTGRTAPPEPGLRCAISIRAGNTPDLADLRRSWEWSRPLRSWPPSSSRAVCGSRGAGFSSARPPVRRAGLATRPPEPLRSGATASLSRRSGPGCCEGLPNPTALPGQGVSELLDSFRASRTDSISLRSDVISSPGFRSSTGESGRRDGFLHLRVVLRLGRTR
jgi:hypothetical protein